MAQLRIHLVWRDVADTMSYRMGVGKACYLCRGYKTIRIAESSDMDSWEALLDHVQKFLMNYARCGNVDTQLYQMEWYELWR